MIGIVTIIVIPNCDSCERLPRELRAQVELNFGWVCKSQEPSVISVYLLGIVTSAVSHLPLFPGVIKFSRRKASCDQVMLRFCCSCGVVFCFPVCPNETISIENFKQP